MSADALLSDGTDRARTADSMSVGQRGPASGATSSSSGEHSRRPVIRPDAHRPNTGTARDVLRARFRACAALTVPVAAVSWMPPLQVPYWQWISLVLATAVIVWGALPIHRAALLQLRRGAASADLLASLAVVVAYGASVRTLLVSVAGAPEYEHTIPLAAVRGGSTGQLYLDVAALITTSLLGARLLMRSAGVGERADTRCGADSAAADRASAWFVPAVLLTAAAAASFWFGGGGSRTAALEVALAVLVVGCPIALALAEPIASLAAADALRRRGVALRGSHVLGSGRGITAILVATPRALAPDAAQPPPMEATAVARLRGLDLDPVLLTENSADVARTTADTIGIDAVVAGLGAKEWAGAVRRLQDAGAAVAVISTEPADAPALAAADLGIAVAPTGCAAPAAADVVVSDAGDAVEMLHMGRRLEATVRANRRWTAGVIAAALPVAAAGLLHPTVALVVVATCAGGVAARSHGLRGPAPKWGAAVRPSDADPGRSS